jgi:NADH-quinone oxidoreductase subunit N
MPSISINPLPLLPLLLASIAAVAALLFDVLGKGDRRRSIPMIAMWGTLLAGLAAILLRGGGDLTAFSGFVRTSSLATTGIVAAMIATAATILMTIMSRVDSRMATGEYYCLVMLAASGMIVVATAGELISMLIGIEVISLSSYVLAGFHQDDRRSNEAAFKYFLLGAMASAILIYGLAFLYGATGTTVLAEIATRVQGGEVTNVAWLSVGTVLVFAAFCFKLTLAPFHMYAPDVYEGAPTPITSLIATGAKVAGFLGLWNLFAALAGRPLAFGADNFDLSLKLSGLIASIALLSMFVGNLGAFVQTNLKRMLAYSSIAHAGYLGLAFLALPVGASQGDAALVTQAHDALGYYLLGYTLMNVVAFAALAWLGEGYEEIDSLRGLFRAQPVAASTMAVALLALTGLPPTVGFFAKWQVFFVAVDAGYTSLALAGALLSIFSAYYYLRPVVMMFFGASRTGDEAKAIADTEAQPPAAILSVARASLIAAAVALILVGPLAFYL